MARTQISLTALRLHEQKSARRRVRLRGRERVSEAMLGACFVAVAVPLALFAEAERTLSVGLAVAMVAAYALIAAPGFSTGAVLAVPTQVVFVPMLLLLPTPVVPLLVALALMAETGVAVVRGSVTAERLLASLADAWYAVPPAIVLIAFGAQTPRWEDWPIYVLALAAQLAGDVAVAVIRFGLALGVGIKQLLNEARQSQIVDTLLSPIGLLAAMASAARPFTALLVLPLVVLFSVFSRDRQGRIEQTIELGQAYRGTALLLGDVIEADDQYTGQHTEDVVELVVAVADTLRLDEDTRRAAELGALLHDVGKIAIPKSIINKAGPLDDEEWALMKTHTIEGQRMLERVGGLLSRVGVVVRASHERWDGGGYPDGLVGDEIPLAARIVSACDAFNAMTTDRSYRRALPLATALSELFDNAGSQFDPTVVAALAEVIGSQAGRPGALPEPAVSRQPIAI